MTDITKSNTGHPEVSNVWQLLAWYSTKHGALVFGVITVLTMWMVIFQPELERNEVRNEVLRGVINDMHKHASDQQQITDQLKTTAQILDKITARQELDK